MDASAECRETAVAVKLPGTSHEEKRNRISIRPERDERVEFYRLDSNEVRACLARDLDEGIEGIKLCDVVVRYRVSPRADSSAVVFAELKGAHIPDAFEQIDSSIHRVKPHLERLWPEAKSWLAVIVHSGGAPRKTSDLKSNFRRKHPDFTIELKSKKCDVRELLRNAASS
jgi:hypothetical protein